MTYKEQLCSFLRSIGILNKDSIVNENYPKITLEKYFKKKLYGRGINLRPGNILVYSSDLDAIPPKNFRIDFPIDYAGFVISNKFKIRYIIFYSQNSDTLKNLYLSNHEKYNDSEIFCTFREMPCPRSILDINGEELDWEIKKNPMPIPDTYIFPDSETVELPVSVPTQEQELGQERELEREVEEIPPLLTISQPDKTAIDPYNVPYDPYETYDLPNIIPATETTLEGQEEESLPEVNENKSSDEKMEEKNILPVESAQESSPQINNREESESESIQEQNIDDINDDKENEIIKNEWMYLIGLTDNRPDTFKKTF